MTMVVKSKLGSKSLKASKSSSEVVAKSARSSATKKPPQDRKGASVQSPISDDSPRATRIIAVCNQKGGCGKTTTVINVAAGLASMGLRVLVVDLDSQGNATSGLGIAENAIDLSMFHMLSEPKKYTLESIVLESPYPNLHVAPASIELSELESRISNEVGRENRLKKALAMVIGYYDYILIDTPPSLGLLSVNALNAAKEVHIAMQAHPFAFDGLNLLLETIEMIKEELNPSLEVTGIVVTMYDHRTKISREIVDKVRLISGLKSKVYPAVIRQNVKLTEASKVRAPVRYYDASCSGTLDYEALSNQIHNGVFTDSKAVTLSSSKVTKQPKSVDSSL